MKKLLILAALFATFGVAQSLPYFYCADAGSTDDYACNLTPYTPAAYVTGGFYSFKANTANTGAATVNFNSLGAKTIVKVAGGITTDLATNDIRVGQYIVVQYDGTNMQMQSTLGNAAASTVALSSITAAAAGNTIANGNNAQVWNWAPTTSGLIGITLGETTASTSAGTPYLAKLVTLAGSTATPLNITNSLTGSQVLPSLSITPTWNTSGAPTALDINVTCTAAASAPKLIDLRRGGTSYFSVKGGGTNCTTAGSVDLATGNFSATTGSFVSNGNVQYYASASGVAQLMNAAFNGFTRIQMGGTSSSFSGICVTNQANPILSACDASGGATESFRATGFIHNGTTYTLSTNTCSGTTLVGGATAGTFVSGTTGSCTGVVTMGNGVTAITGWKCNFGNRTSAAAASETASTTTTATFAIATVSGEVVAFTCDGF